MYAQVQDLIKVKKYNQATVMLNGIENRNAVWYYLSSVIAYKKAFFESALENINKAISLDGTNNIYNNFHTKLMSRFSSYSRDYHRTPRYRQNNGCCPCGDCECCQLNCCDLICLDSCCECCGGDLISCI
ncbi:hypothetical protein [Candidatus Epulonipiscium viviparus]|uniref:hypothetical protein n=1 Tax=Candidatus Epulonipiscium viviparus TaxID=420336 RepID=UPI00016BFDB6|nr:hypothetical protein [Candidatus Epulopiscium viviparus]